MTIKNKNIKPLPKWHFFLKNFFLWGMSFIFFLGGVFVMGIFFLWADHLEFFSFLIEKPILLLSLGIFWIFFFWGGITILLSLFSKFSLEHTKKGYKYPTHFIVIGVLFFQALGGFAFIHIESLHSRFFPNQEKIPFHCLLEEEKRRIWMNPEEGFLTGKIFSFSENTILLLDREKKEWTILVSEKTKIPPFLKIIPEERIRIEGEKINENTFSAQKIFPFEGRRTHLDTFFSPNGRREEFFPQ